MSSEIRRRNVNTSGGEHIVPMATYDETHLSAPALLAASPIHAGFAMKLHVPVFYSFLPSPVQWVLSSWCPTGWSPQWKRRYLIALGGYLYRFKDENGSTPKGAPITVDITEARIISRGDTSTSNEFNCLLDLLPDGCDTVFEVSSLAKTQYFAVESREEALAWVNSIRQMRQDSITRNMGHSKGMPYPKQWESFDASARRLQEQKERIKNRMSALDKKEQEMQTLGGSANMGYFS
mmetsp:Transcript_3888/g.8285  ORF Transcript_3888/g.8285 Transcript_3888/m.8285 type:complete len:236 (+) Transcript_3888:79-786(+)